MSCKTNHEKNKTLKIFMLDFSFLLELFISYLNK